MTDTALMVMVQISDAERQEIKRIAKSKGMTLSGLMGQLVRSEIRNNQISSDISSHLSDRIQGTATPGALDFGSR